MADGTRSRVDCERRSGRRRRKNVLENLTKKEQSEPVARTTEGDASEPVVPDCAVCLQPCVYPSRLPCSHIFCFLCLKGIVSQSMKCAMCRQQIPADYLDHPDLVALPSDAKAKEDMVLEGGYQWFYEGRDGWWQYDVRTSRELEAAYKGGERTCELLVAGYLYVADLTAMLQVRRDQAFRVRRIKRDLASIPNKGVAGLRLPPSSVTSTAAPSAAPSADTSSGDSLSNQLANLSLAASSPPPTSQH